MVEKDWMVDIRFFHQITGIDLDFFYRYMTNEQDFGLDNIAYLSSDILNRKA